MLRERLPGMDQKWTATRTDGGDLPPWVLVTECQQWNTLGCIVSKYKHFPRSLTRELISKRAYSSTFIGIDNELDIDYKSLQHVEFPTSGKILFVNPVATLEKARSFEDKFDPRKRFFVNATSLESTNRVKSVTTRVATRRFHRIKTRVAFEFWKRTNLRTHVSFFLNARSLSVTTRIAFEFWKLTNRLDAQRNDIAPPPPVSDCVGEPAQKPKTRRGGKKKKPKQALGVVLEDAEIEETQVVMQNLSDLSISVDEALKCDTESVAESSLASALACVVCLERCREKAAIPCGHRCFCSLCADKFSCPGAKCPVCRAEIVLTCEIFG